jgi:hypothetical protein
MSNIRLENVKKQMLGFSKVHDDSDTENGNIEMMEKSFKNTHFAKKRQALSISDHSSIGEEEELF